MAFNLGAASNNTGKLHMADFIGSDTTVSNTEKEIPIDLLVPWENQPFKMYSDFKMNELAESIKENGLLSRIIVSPIENGKYRIIAGHNRVEACRRAGFTNIPSIIKNVDENRAKLMMADTNLCQRTELLPSERARAYKVQQEALIALGSPRSTLAIAEKYGEGQRTIQRYIACSRLVPELMDMLDSGRLSLIPAVSFSGMPDTSQREIATWLNSDPERKISADKAAELAEIRFVTADDIEKIINGTVSHENSAENKIAESARNIPANNTERKKKSNQYGKKITLQRSEVTSIIGDELSNDDIAEFFYFCLQKTDVIEEWRMMYQSEETGSSEDEQPDEEDENEM